MEATLLYTPLSLLLLLLFLLALKFMSTNRSKNLPPSPVPALPIIGHLHLLKQPLHRTLYKLSKKHGPIFSLRFGTRLVIIVSSSTAAEECFTKNDIVLANRPSFSIGKYIGYNNTNMAGASYGEHWRNLRRLSSLEIFSASRLNIFSWIRQDEIKRLILSLYRNSKGGTFVKVVDLRGKLTELSYNVIMRMVAGKRYYGEDEENENEEAKRFRVMINEVLLYGGASNPGDFLPVLRWIDYQGLEKKLERIGKEMDVFFQGLIDEHRGVVDDSRNTMISHLLSLQEKQPEYYTDQIIKGLIMVLLIAGTDTSALTIEWAMSALLNHPDVLKKARAELDTHLGFDYLIHEEKLTQLHYLQNIISETLRLFPAVPLLLPHESSTDCTIGGYNVPRDTLLLVNAWAIHRDPNVWDDPTSFRPERFEVVKIEAHKLMPFGMGRRSCPGVGLAHRVVGLVLGSLIQGFEWERISEELVDLSEGNGLTMPKAKPFVATCRARSIMEKVLLEEIGMAHASNTGIANSQPK